MAYYDFVTQEPVVPPTPTLSGMDFAGPANDTNYAYSGSGTTYQTFYGVYVPYYASGNGTSTLTFVRPCTLCVFLASGRVRNDGTSSITAYKNGIAIGTASNASEPYYNSISVIDSMKAGDTLRIAVVGTDEGYAIHSWRVSLFVTT